MQPRQQQAVACCATKTGCPCIGVCMIINWRLYSIEKVFVNNGVIFVKKMFAKFVLMKGRLAYVFDDENVGRKFIQAVIDSKVSVLFIYNYLEEKGVSERYVKMMLLEAVADKKLPFKVALLMQKYGNTLDEDLLVKAYMNGSMTPADMGSLL